MKWSPADSSSVKDLGLLLPTRSLDPQTSVSISNLNYIVFLECRLEVMFVSM